jgi:DNA-binding GntR family transcriptional regulator
MKEKLSAQVARGIAQHIREAPLPEGRHLSAQKLADLFRVSRAPVNAALAALAEEGVVRLEPRRGYFVVGAPVANAETPPPAQEDDLYFRLAEDRLAGQLPDRVSENELMRLYAVSRPRLQLLLGQIAEEGWIARLPGHGWEFQSTLSSPEAYAQAYRFRAAIETGALDEPEFTVDQDALARARAEQEELLSGAMLSLPRDQLYRINATFHEMIVGWSGNAFFVEALRRVNRMRRLIEYRSSVDRGRLERQCREHLALLDLFAAGHIGAAREYLRAHIGHAWEVKARISPSGG